MSSAASPSRGKQGGLSAALILVAVVAALLWPLLGLVVAVIATLHAHVEGLTTVRNVLLAFVVIAAVGFVLFGIGGSVTGGVTD